MVKVKCIKYYHDKELDKYIDENKVYEVTEERAKVLEDNKVAVIVKTTKKAK